MLQKKRRKNKEKLISIVQAVVGSCICDSTWEKGPSRALFQNRVIATAGKSRLLATKCATYLVMKAKCSGVIAVSVHSFLSTAIS